MTRLAPLLALLLQSLAWAATGGIESRLTLTLKETTLTLEGNVNDIEHAETLTRLAPMGKILVNGIVREAKSLEGYIDEHQAVEVVSVSGTSISVKPIKE